MKYTPLAIVAVEPTAVELVGNNCENGVPTSISELP